ncbi:MAG TPA: acyltransferase [Candidatus Baltobacteraceae bacterium]
MNWLLKSTLSTLARSIFRFKSFGRGSVIKPFCRRVSGTEFVSIGDDCFFGDGLVLIATAELNGMRHQPSCTIGNRCVFGTDFAISCTNTIEIGDNVLAGPRVFVGDSYHDYEDVTKPVIDQPMAGEKPIKIGEGTFLGIGSIILPGTTLGKGCYVSGNCVVTGQFPDYTVIAGAPGRAVRRYDPTEKKWTFKMSAARASSE